MSRFGILNTLYIAGFALIGQMVLSGYTTYFALIFLVLSYLLILIFGVFRVGFEFFMEIENAGDSRYNEIAISFDDGPHPEITQKVLEKLNRFGVKAAFFCIGKNAEAQREIVKEIHDSGHIIGNHSYQHTNNFPIFSSSKIKNDLEKCSKIITDLTGIKPRFFRPPFGITNPRIAKAVKTLDLTVVGWSLRTFDTSKSPSKVIHKIKKNLTGGDLILLHDNHEGIIEILDFLIPFAEENGLKFVRPDELIKKEAYATQL
jgi:peptidoglycan/xylan/chitin deacetylase (PgdA/CDA1 family)